VIGAVLSSGGGDEPQQAENRRQQPADGQKADKAKKKEKEPKAQEEQQAQPAPAPAPDEDASEEPPTTSDSASGVELNNQGYALMQQGNYEGAVPILQDAVASWPEGSQDINYAYALFNLGKSLNRSGRPDEAIPYLEQRLQWNDQRETVQAELDLARQNAGEG
jgi:tetratricopeptide (TPR) repeat protein